MSWNKRMDEMVGTWTDMQHKMWDSWLQAVNSFSGQGTQGGHGQERWKQEYRKNLEAWESSVRQALDAQAHWAETWADKVAAEEQSEAASRWAQQVQEMMGGWTQAQSQLWNAWFESVRGLDPSQVASRWDSEGQQVLEAWREAAERAQETLAEWSRVAAASETAQPAPKRKKQ